MSPEPLHRTLRLPPALWLCALLSLTACDPAPPDPAAPAPPAAPTVFRYTMEEVPSGFDPLRASTIYASAVVLAVHDTLYRYQYLARPYVLAPNLAAALPEVSADGLTWTIRLRDDVRFADDPVFADGKGRPLVAADVVYSFQRHFHPESASEGAWLWQESLAGIDDWKQAGGSYDIPWTAVVAVDAHTVQFKLSKPFPSLAHTLVQGYSAIVAREAVEHYGADLALHPVGSGPFRLRAFDGAVARLERNPGYRQVPLDLQTEGFDPAVHGDLGLFSLAGRSPPFVDQLELQFIADARLRLQNFERGDSDLSSIAGTFFPQVLEQPQPLALKPKYAQCCHAVLQPLTELVYMAFNFKDPQLGRAADPAVDRKHRALRCAIGAAYDWTARNRQFNQGAGRVFAGVIVPAAPEFVPLPTPTLDGKTLLAQAGWTTDTLPTLRFASTGGADMQGVFEQLRSDLVQHLNWPLDKLQWDSFPNFGAYNDAVNNGSLMLMDVGWRLDYPDALNTLQLFYGPYAPPQVNAGAYQNARFDALYEQAQALPAGPDRTALAQAMNQMLIDDCAFLGGYARSALMVWHKDALVYPDREMLGGHFLKFVARQP